MSGRKLVIKLIKLQWIIALTSVPKIGGYGRIRFYGDYFLKGHMKFTDLEESDGCVNLEFGLGHMSSLSTYGTCVVLYNGTDCTGRSIRETRGESFLSEKDFNDQAVSYRLCTQEEAVLPDPRPHLTLFKGENYHQPLISYYDLCWCETVPDYMRNTVSSVNTHGNCIYLWDKEDCQGNFLQLEPGQHFHGQLRQQSWNNRTVSISVCSDSQKCSKRLHAIVERIEFKITDELKKILKNSPPTKRVELGPPALYINSGRAHDFRLYEASRLVEESYEFDLNPGLKLLDSIGIDDSVPVTVTGGMSDAQYATEFSENVTGTGAISSVFSNIASSFLDQYSVDIPFLREMKFKEHLQKALPYQTKSGSGWREKYVAKNMKPFRIRDSIKIPRGKTFYVRSYVDMVENVAVPYDIHLQIFGWDYTRQMNSEEVKNELTLMPQFQISKDDEKGNPIYAKAILPGKLRTSFGVRSYAEIDSKGISLKWLGDAIKEGLKEVAKEMAAKLTKLLTVLVASAYPIVGPALDALDYLGDLFEDAQEFFSDDDDEDEDEDDDDDEEEDDVNARLENYEDEALDSGVSSILYPWLIGR